MSEKALAIVDAEPVDTGTGEIVKREEFQGYAGVATTAVTEAQANALMEAFPDEDHDILPTGEVYVSQVHVRRKLNEVFRPGGWALVPRGPFAREGNTVCREYALLGPGGVFLSESIGESEYQPNNTRMSYASACEAAKSNALTRCGKDLGIASECWDRRWCDDWKAKHAVAVWRKDTSRGPQWRRKDAPAFYDEKGAADPQQNRDRDDAPRSSSPAPAPPQEHGERPACPQHGTSEKVILSRFPKKGKWFCLKCDHPFNDEAAGL